MNPVYLAIENEHDTNATYFKFRTIFAAISFIVTQDIVDYTLSDRPFIQEDGIKTEIDELVAAEYYTVIHQ